MDENVSDTNAERFDVMHIVLTFTLFYSISYT